jgi:hypothetical protein
VLSYALGAGKAIVSTPFLHAKELLDGDVGRLVPFRDSAALGREVSALLFDDEARNAMRRRAYARSREMLWDRVAQRYLGVFNEIRADRSIRPRTRLGRQSLLAISNELPQPLLDHLRLMTDDVGILQHARFNLPDREHGYCTDDNARAFVVALMALQNVPDATDMWLLAGRCLIFLRHAFHAPTGRFRNFMGFTREWLEDIGSEDSHGRAIWALGKALTLPSSESFTNSVMELFERALPAALDLRSIRPWAFSLLGACAYLQRYGGASEVRRACTRLADQLHMAFVKRASEDWPWPEETVTYANGVLPEALIVAGRQLDNQDMVQTGLRSLRWLARLQTDPKGYFVPIGNRGWLTRDGRQARFDQQPTEAQHMIDALLAAQEATGDTHWIKEARRCFDWYLGRNDLQQPICDHATGGCRDGLTAEGANPNQGAESTLAWLHSLFVMQSIAAVKSELKRKRVSQVYADANNGHVQA